MTRIGLLLFDGAEELDCVLPDRTVEDAGPLDVVLVPGGQGTRPLVEDEPTHESLRGLAGGGTLVTSVCTGSLVLAGAGLLRDRPATTWWRALDPEPPV